MFSKIIKIVFNIVLMLSCIICITLSDFSFAIKIILLILDIMLFLLSYIVKYFKCRIHKLIYLFFIGYSSIIVIYQLIQFSGIMDKFSSVHNLKNYILSTKEKGVILYILIQCAQVIFLPIPAAIICVAGTLIYGPLLSGIYCSIGILLGSYIAFFIGRTFGYRIVTWLVGKDKTEKYSEVIRNRGVFFLGLAFLMPMFPDDILCSIAGITQLNFKSFFWITFITRPIGVVCMSYFSSGELIPFSGWGIYIWLIILVFAITLSILIYKYQEKMQNFVLSKIFIKRK